MGCRCHRRARAGVREEADYLARERRLWEQPAWEGRRHRGMGLRTYWYRCWYGCWYGCWRGCLWPDGGQWGSWRCQCHYHYQYQCQHQYQHRYQAPCGWKRAGVSMACRTECGGGSGDSMPLPAHLAVQATGGAGGWHGLKDERDVSPSGDGVESSATV